MLMQEPIKEMIKEWTDLYNIYKDKLVPNIKEALKIIEYLKDKYIIEEIENEKILFMTTLF